MKSELWRRAPPHRAPSGIGVPASPADRGQRQLRQEAQSPPTYPAPAPHQPYAPTQ